VRDLREISVPVHGISNPQISTVHLSSSNPTSDRFTPQNVAEYILGKKLNITVFLYDNCKRVVSSIVLSLTRQFFADNWCPN